MKFYLPLLLLLVTSCGSKKEDAAPAPPPVVPKLEYYGSYNMAYLEDVSPTITLSLSATPSAYWINTLNTKEPYYSSEVSFPPYLYSTVAGETVTLTLRVPRMPSTLRAGADYRAVITFAGQTKRLFMDRDYLSNPANYGPSGAVVSASITRP